MAVRRPAATRDISGRMRRSFCQGRHLLLWRMTANDVLGKTIAAFGRKYLWWQPVGGQPFSEDRIIAQTMNLGTYDDILLLEQTVGKTRLVQVMLHAEPGWINDRSWEFW